MALGKKKQSDQGSCFESREVTIFSLPTLNLEQTGWITKRVSVLLSKAAKFVRLGCGPQSALPTLEIPDYLYHEVRDSYAKHWAHKRRFEGKGQYYTNQYCTISPNTCFRVILVAVYSCAAFLHYGSLLMSANLTTVLILFK